MLRRPVRTLASALAAVAVLASVHGAAAASLGPLTAKRLGAWQWATRPAVPTVRAWDGFTRPDGTLLNNEPTPGGGPVWQVVRGTWTTVGNRAQESANTADAVILVDCRATDVTTSVVLSAGPAAFSGGLALAGSGTTFLSVNYRSQGGGSVTLAKSVGATMTTLATAGNVGSPGTVTLSATYAGGTVTVAVGGTVVITHGLSTADRTLLGSNTRQGLYVDRETRVRFDDFRCETP
jgi:hypothetical protein